MTQINLEGKTAIVTGASRGIGKSIALKLAEAGCFVFVVNRSLEAGQKVVDEIKSLGGDGIAAPADVSNEEQCSKVVKDAMTLKGRIDILVNNAGVTKDNIFVRMKTEEWNTVFQTNLNSAFFLSREVIRPMMKARGGRIVNISSIVGYTGNPGQVNYSASKSALIGFSKSLAKEVASRNITCNVIAPGFIETDMTDALTDEQQKAILGNIPMGAVGKPEDIAHGVLFLVSDLAPYITGTVLHINGGMF